MAVSLSVNLFRRFFTPPPPIFNSSSTEAVRNHYVLPRYTIFRYNIFRMKCVYRWRRRLLTLSRNKWTFKLHSRPPPVVGGSGPSQWSPITDAVPCTRDKFVPLYFRIYLAAWTAGSVLCSTRNYVPWRLIHDD